MVGLLNYFWINMHQHKLTLYMTISWMVDDEPSIEVFHEMIARTRSIREVNSSWYFVWANWVYWNLELINK